MPGRALPKLLPNLAGNEPNPFAVVGVVHADERNGGFNGDDHLSQIDGQVCGDGAHRSPPFRIGARRRLHSNLDTSDRL